MSSIPRERSRQAYKIECEDGRRYVIYHASVVDNPPDHVPDKWYALGYPLPIGLQAGVPFDTAEEAEDAARDRKV